MEKRSIITSNDTKNEYDYMNIAITTYWRNIVYFCVLFSK